MASKADTGQSRFTAQWTHAQKDAILRSVLIDGRSIAETIRMANAGTLGLPAFKIGRYAYDLIRQGREAYELENPEALSVAIDKQLMAMAGKALSQSRALAMKAEADPDQIRRTVLALKTAQHAIRPETKPAAKPSASPQGEPEPSTAPETTLTALLGKAPARQRTATQQSAPNPVASRAA